MIPAAHVLGIFDIICAVVLLAAMAKITTKFGFQTLEARWALFRRLVYVVMIYALFRLGIMRLNNSYPAETIEECAWQGVLLFGIMIFPLMRALGFLTQDFFTHVDGVSGRQRDPRRRPF